MFAFLKKLFGSKQDAEAAVPYKIEAPQAEAAPVSQVKTTEAKPTKEKPVRKPRAKKSVKK